MLLDFIRTKKEGALLVCGKRGVGKTSAVFSAIIEARRLEEYNPGASRKGVRILPIVVNAPGFESRKVGETSGKKTDNSVADQNSHPLTDPKRLVLQHVVRRLYQETKIRNKDGMKIPAKSSVKSPIILDYKFWSTHRKPSKNPTEVSTKNEENLSDSVGISDLFTRAVATEVRDVVNLEQLENESRAVERGINLSFSIEKLFGIGASFVAAIVIALDPIVKGPLNSVISLLAVLIPSILAISWHYRKTSSSVSTGEKKDSLYYRHDYDTSTLQSELEEKLHELAKRNFKVVFVIDELDKLPKEEVIETIKSLKTFFNQSSTLFILLAGKEFFDTMLQDIEDRPTQYTLFPQKMFLQRPLFTEMEEFIDKITNNQGDIMYGKDYENFRNYACYACKTDFFDLYNVIRDHITYDKYGAPRLNVNLVDQKYVIQAELQKALGQLYSQKKYESPSEWHSNDLLLSKMYELLETSVPKC